MKHTNKEGKTEEKKKDISKEKSAEKPETEAVSVKSEKEETEEETKAQEPESETNQEEAQESSSIDELEKTKKDFEVLKAKYDKLNDTYLRALAEYDNYRKRTLKEKSELIKSGGESVLVSILSVVDDMERGIASMNKTEDIGAIREGMGLIHGKFQNFLKQNGVEEIETEGKDFDTDLHEAIATVPATDESMKDKIIDCAQKGYSLHGKVIRFAKVVVGK